MLMVEMVEMVETMVVPTKGLWHAIPKSMVEMGGPFHYTFLCVVLVSLVVMWIALTRWIEQMENVTDNSGCAENQKVKYGYIKNHKKTIKNKQARTRERKSEQKPEVKPGKSSLSQIQSNYGQ
ncbi:hypothetical protein Tco_0642567 [Tanacetum coccineum]